MKKIALTIALVLITSSALADPLKIMKSKVPQTFAAEVSSYAQEFVAWKDHMAKAAADKAAGVPKDKAFAAYPPPIADPLVMSAVDVDGKPNYQIIDDSPSPDQILAQKKQALLLNIAMAERQAIDALIPAGKRRFFDLHQNDVLAADQTRATAILESQPSGWFLGIGSKKDPAKAQSDAVAQRPPEDTKFMQDQAIRQEKLKAIEKSAAQMQSDVEDLTATNVDGWQMPALPN